MTSRKKATSKLAWAGGWRREVLSAIETIREAQAFRKATNQAVRRARAWLRDGSASSRYSARAYVMSRALRDDVHRLAYWRTTATLYAKRFSDNFRGAASEKRFAALGRSLTRAVQGAERAYQEAKDFYWKESR